MDLLKLGGDVIKFFQSPGLSTVTILVGGAVGTFCIWKLTDKVIDEWLKRIDPDKFLIRVVAKSEFFASWIVKSFRYFDDRVLDPVKKNLPKTGENIEDAICRRIDQIKAIFNKAFDDAKLIVNDKK